MLANNLAAVRPARIYQRPDLACQTYQINRADITSFLVYYKRSTGCYHPLNGTARLAIYPPLPGGACLVLSDLLGSNADCVVGSRPPVSIRMVIAELDAITA